jgi:hypothetical protein
MIDDEVKNFLEASLDEASTLLSKVPVQGSGYFKTRNVSNNNYSSQEMLGIGLAEVNSDLEDLPVDKQIAGYKQTISNFVLRKSMAIGREALETDRFGVIGEHSRNLTHSGLRTTQFILADMFNRGFGTANGGDTVTTNLSALAEDGLALFSGSRPQPRATAGEWSNLIATGALTPDVIADTRVAFNIYLDGNGDLAPQMLEKVIVSPELEDTMREISGSTLKVDTSLNTTNIVSGTSYEVWHYLNANTALFCGDADNGVEFHIRKNPDILTWEDGSNPDKIWSRLYMALGTGIKRPGKWMGQLVS